MHKVAKHWTNNLAIWKHWFAAIFKDLLKIEFLWFYSAFCTAFSPNKIKHSRNGFIVNFVLLPVGPYLAKVYKSLANFGMVNFLFGTMLSLLWQICDIIGLIFIVTNGQILKNNLTIWSHWSPLPSSKTQDTVSKLSIDDWVPKPLLTICPFYTFANRPTIATSPSGDLHVLSEMEIWVLASRVHLE